MAIPKTKLVTLEIDPAWTRIFVIDHERGSRLKILSKATLPTSLGEPIFAVKALFEKLSLKPDANPLIWTSNLTHATPVAEELKGIFVPEEQVRKSLTSWLKSQGYPSCSLLSAGGELYHTNYKASEVGSFLTFAVGEMELENHLANLSLHPQTIPETSNELEITESLMRASFKQKAALLGEANNILITGHLTALHPNLARLALLVLDILGVGKVADVVVDKFSLGNCWGAALTKYRDLEDFEIDFLAKLGTFVSLGGAGKVELDYGLKNIQEVVVAENEIALIPAPKDQKVRIAYTLDKEKKHFEANGGDLGILIDARKKPLQLDVGTSRSQHAMLAWRAAIEKVELIK